MKQRMNLWNMSAAQASHVGSNVARSGQVLLLAILPISFILMLQAQYLQDVSITLKENDFLNNAQIQRQLLVAEIPNINASHPFLAPRRINGKLIYNMHIHKTGGTTLCEIARANNQRTSSHNCLPMYDTNRSWGCCGPNNTLASMQEFARTVEYDFLGPEAPMKQTMDLENYRYMITMRRSFDRYVSHWKHERRIFAGSQSVADFQTWWQQDTPDNFFVRHIGGCPVTRKFQLTPLDWKTTVERLAKFDLILFMEDYENSLVKLEQRLGWKIPADRRLNEAPPSSSNSSTFDMDANWDPLMTVLDDALYDIAVLVDKGLPPVLSTERQEQVDEYFVEGPKRGCTNFRGSCPAHEERRLEFCTNQKALSLENARIKMPHFC